MGATTVAVISIATAVAGAAASAYGQYQQGQAAAQQYKYQADVSKKQGQLAELSARQQAAKIQENAQHRRATQIAEGAAAGVDVNSASLLDVIASSAKTAEEERQDVLRAGRLNSAAYNSQATSYGYSASTSKSSSYFGAGASLLGGLSTGIRVADKAGWFDNYEGDGQKK